MGVVLAALLLVGCSAGSGLLGNSDTTGSTKRDLGLTRDWNVLGKAEPKARTVQASDLVTADGRCAGEPAAPSAALNFQAGPESTHTGVVSPASPMQPGMSPRRGIYLDMTECDVVGAAGHTDRVDISTNDHGGRRVVLSYLQGDHAGIYQFDDGRLKSIARAPQAQASDKPQKSKGGARQTAGN
jgi:hypothetical protein